ncbi:MAG: hypothetical protein OJF50_003036 [Nitrospira sp.]|nr:hypothetical protein [Nitrospira sp.]
MPTANRGSLDYGHDRRQVGPPSLLGAEEAASGAAREEAPGRSYRTDLWTLKCVAQLIHQQFGIRYHPCHVWKLLTQLGWSCQNPERCALQRNEAAIARWKRSRWPHIKKRRTTGRPSGLPR